MIPEGYRVRGDGRCLVLDCSAPAGLGDAVVSSAVLPGPFLVVSVLLWEAVPDMTSGALLTIVPAPVNINAVAGVRLPIFGVQLHAGGPSALSGATQPDPIGDASGRGSDTGYFPWFLYEGDSAALALWVRPALGAMRWWAAVSVWPLERELVAGRRVPAFSPHRDFAAPVERMPPAGMKYEVVLGGGGLYWTIIAQPTPHWGGVHGSHRSSSAAWRSGGGSGGSVRVAAAAAPGRAEPGRDVGGVPGRTR